jgi:hypothetical protein
MENTNSQATRDIIWKKYQSTKETYEKKLSEVRDLQTELEQQTAVKNALFEETRALFELYNNLVKHSQEDKTDDTIR